MQDHESLIAHLVGSGALSTQRILDAFRAIDRKDFVRDEDIPAAYLDQPIPIGHGQTISQPTTVAFMLELLQPEEGDAVLDVGSGSGWTSALLRHITGEHGHVVAIEIIPDLVRFGKANIRKYFEDVEVLQAKPEQYGVPGKGPWDVILVSAAADDFPEDLVMQMREGGRMAIPVGKSVFLVERFADGTRKTEYPGFAFVPLR